jgi:hypothetical protein
MGYFGFPLSFVTFFSLVGSFKESMPDEHSAKLNLVENGRLVRKPNQETSADAP